LNNINQIIDRMRIVTNARTYEDLAKKLGITLSGLNSWKKMGKIPEKNILKCMYLTNTTREYLLYGEINQDKISINGNHNLAINGNNNNNIILDDKKAKNDLNIQIDIKDTGKTTRENEPMAFEFYLKEVCDLLKEYGSFSLIWELRKKLLQIKALHDKQ